MRHASTALLLTLLLDRDGRATAALPAKAGQVTVIVLDRLTVQRVLHAADAAQLRKALALPSAE